MKTVTLTKKRDKTTSNRSGNFKCLVMLLVVALGFNNYLHGSNKNSAVPSPSTVSVVAVGTVSAMPDIARMTISLSNMSPTTKEAQEEVNKMVGQALEVLKDFKVEDSNIITTSLTFSPEYKNDIELIGQRVTQTIEFSIQNIQNNDEKVTRIIDRLVNINGIGLRRIDFMIDDNSEYFVLSRELAYLNAVEKAEQYAKLSGLKVVKVLNIWEEGSQSVRQGNGRSSNQDILFSASPTMLPYGELNITTRITVEFILK